MLFDASHFEQFFGEQALKKGLSLFERGNTLIRHRQGFELGVEAGSAIVVLRKKGDRVLSYTCSCGSKQPCEHLAAALFMLQQDRLSMTRTDTGRKRSARAGSGERHLYSWHYQRLRKLMREPGTTDGSEKNKGMLAPERVLAAEAIKLADEQGTVLADLVVVTVLSPLFSGTAAMSAGLKKMFQAALARLRALQLNTLSLPEKQAWLLAAERSLRSAQMMQSGVYAWLVPRGLLITRDTDTVKALQLLADKRRVQKAFHDSNNPLLVLRCMIALRLKDLGQGEVPARLRKGDPEFSIACAEYSLLKGRPERALSALARAVNSQPSAAAFSGLLDYAIALSHNLGDAGKELHFIKTGLIHLPVLHRDRLQRFFVLAGEADVQEITAQLRAGQRGSAHEKFKDFLMASGQYQQLFLLLRNEKDSFQRLHELAIRQLPEPGEELLRVYCRQLENAFSHAVHESRKENLVEKLAVLMKGLAGTEKRKMAAGLPADILYLLKQRLRASNSSVLQ